MSNFFKKMEEAKASDLPFVAFRKPDAKELKGYIQENRKLFQLDSFEASGFIMSPFRKDEKKFIFPAGKCDLIQVKFDDDLDSEMQRSGKISEELSEQDRDRHIRLVEDGLEHIKSNKAKKIVLSRKEEIILKEPDKLALFAKMLNLYPKAFVYIWFHPKVGLWLGATPECLLRVEENEIHTMALAGTQPRSDTSDTFWNKKELQEQAFVTDFVLERLNPFVGNLQSFGPYTVEAGSIVHLRTDITGELKNKAQFGALVHELHPTPAVCGIPLQSATEFILNKEGYERSFYTGYMGEINMDGKSELYVNLRCMQINPKTVTLYIGGGITIDSLPEKEWQETVDKSAIMKKVLED